VHNETDDTNNMKNYDTTIRFYTSTKIAVTIASTMRIDIMVDIRLSGPSPILQAGPAQRRTKCRKINAACAHNTFLITVL